MLTAILHSLSNTLVLLFTGAFGWWLAHMGYIDRERRAFIAKLVNLSIPFFLFNSVTSRFTHDQLIELLSMGFIPFITMSINFIAAVTLVKLGLVRAEWRGTFIACFCSATVLFVGVPMTMAIFGEQGIPLLLVYFFANCLFVWTVGLYCVQLDGVHKVHGLRPRIISRQSFHMLFSPPLVAFLIGVAVILIGVSVPNFIAGTARTIGQITSPLALIFIGMTIESMGFEKLKHLPREIWLILGSCFIFRPVIVYLTASFFGAPREMIQVLVAASALPCTSVIAVLAKTYGADETFASEAIGATTLGLVFVLPVLLVVINLI
ncbi:AEC family transporter [Sutterella sp.]|uniref:AEC family transporter n=1 Tax=Sutterella sp. TaxID=1981025 RepID=UPI0026DFB8FB|nr:AEC family transporter [Sutterella sp.]MDO5531889.1 AEC family transporter [Sutterella sp.]